MRSLSTKRKKIWQLEKSFHCSLVGTCITLGELRQLSSKLKLDFKTTASDYDIHHTFVHIAGNGTNISYKLQKFLDNKFSRNIRNVNFIDSEIALRNHWEAAISSGDLAGDYWAIVTHPLAGTQLRDKIYSDVHMLSHLAGASVRIDMEAFKQLKISHKSLRLQLKDLKSCTNKRLNNKNSEIKMLKDKLLQENTFEMRYRNIKKTLDCSKSSDKKEITINKLRNKLSLEKQNRIKLEAKLKQTLEQLDTSLHQFEFYKQECKCLTSLLEVKSKDKAINDYSDNHLSNANMVDLCGQCILYVGGRSNLCSHYRTFVEMVNGEFIHHDGGREESPDKLNSTLSQADIIVCPIDCVSHKAVHAIKKHCEVNTKPLVYMPRASMSAFTKALSDAVRK